MTAVRLPTAISLVPDRPILILAASLLLIGLVAISSAAIDYSDLRYEGDLWFHTRRHLQYLAMAAVVSVAVFSRPLQFWQDTGWIWLFISLALLLLVVVDGVGHAVNGSQRWLRVGALTAQPSEFAKLAMVVYLAGYMVRREHQMRHQWQGFVKPMAVLFAITLLLMLEPDFGATVIVAASVFGMLFLAGVKLGHFLLVLLGALAALMVLILSASYRVQRLTAYTDPWADPFASGFQLTQSLIAFGRGDWWGVGLGNSVQKLFYLPEAHTDFVYAIWAEETGFVGALTVIALFVGLIARLLWVGRRAMAAANPFGAYVCYGVALVFSGQAFINMGVNSGLLPTKGLTLPFVSYGGSSLLVCCCMLALVLRVDCENRTTRRRR